MKIDEYLAGVKTVAISGHIHPDGDCIGSCMGMYLYITKNYPDIRVDVFLEEVPEELKFIENTDKINTEYRTDVDVYDLFICQDTAKDRLGEAEKLFENAKKTINIDHHVSNSGCGDINYVVPTASSACELVFDVINEDKIDVEIAKALYTGIVTDTGVFKYNNTSPKTLNTVAKLIAFGFDFGSIVDHVFYEKTYLQNQILGRALLESILMMDGRVCVSVVSRQTMDFYGCTSNDLDGIVNQLLLTIGVNCAIFMYENEPMEYKVSLRSDGTVNVSKIAQIFGGGGHVRASGCNINGTQHDVINSVLQYVHQQLEGTEG
ncbi:MAG: bifunctional oligoribonuclease/PAP phosphatase NrnA [Butyrivibrio sp.]|nr:bifunctional oligoribonuclease/PAP phosphatase NrnA [Butyrivibrio sp.]